MVPILTMTSTIRCPHGGTVVLSTSNTQLDVEGAKALLLTDVHTVAGCPFTIPGPKPQPCVTVRWITGAQHLKVGGTPVLLQSSTGICYSAEQVPQGPPIVSSVQSQGKAV